MHRRVTASLVFVFAAVAWVAGRDVQRARPARSLDPATPLSSVVAVTAPTIGATIPERVREFVDAVHSGADVEGFPLPPATVDRVRALDGLSTSVVVSWLDPITPADTPLAPRFGSNCDFIAYFGDGWSADWEGDTVGGPPNFRGSPTAGRLWVNHEYVSNSVPTETTTATGQHALLEKWGTSNGLIAAGTDETPWPPSRLRQHVALHRRQVGGSWIRVEREGERWRLVPDFDNQRFDATTATRLRITGTTRIGPAPDVPEGSPFRAGVVPGIMADCSGAITPWGTVITAEENVQHYYGDLQACWTGANRFVPGGGFDPGAPVRPDPRPAARSSFGLASAAAPFHRRDAYGYLTEIDPSERPSKAYASVRAGGDGRGHRKIGALGRARWENATFVTGPDFALRPGRPIVLYAGNDRRSGRCYKFVSSGVYKAGMSRARVRALLDEGRTYVAHFADLDNDTGTSVGGAVPSEARRGAGRWIELSLESNDAPPNRDALERPEITVAGALRDSDYNGIGGFDRPELVRAALFTAAMKVGVRETNRPEDLEWSPRDPSGTPRLYIAFTNHTTTVALDARGVLIDPERHSELAPKRGDAAGWIAVLEEADPAAPESSTQFTFWHAFTGRPDAGLFDASCPDNLLIDSKGGVWFGTDGHHSRTSGRASDAIYYLDLDPDHREPATEKGRATYGLAFRIASAPADAEATGPQWSSDERTLFFSAQHPGEKIPSTFPQFSTKEEDEE